MRRALFILVWIACVTGGAANCALAQSGAQAVDGVAARIEDDILTESELRELAAFQKLVDGQSKPRADLIRELGDQWVVRGEAAAAKYPQPSRDDVDRAYAQLVARFASPGEFNHRCAAAGLTETDARRLLAQQLYLSRFLDYRFRPAAQVDQKQIEAYYHDELVPQLKSRGQAVPPLDDVEDTIREVLVQRAISGRATQWLDETRVRLKIDVMPEGDRP
ncbi:MAG TPA: hypothetical protein VMM16_04580 [Verrucomicrobiae bacterium]|nr:hypothetical protein [Verrucomicrobiae bacterium]